MVEEKYCGPVSCCIAVVLVIVFWPAALCVPCCPCDHRRRVVYQNVGPPGAAAVVHNGPVTTY